MAAMHYSGQILSLGQKIIRKNALLFSSCGQGEELLGIVLQGATGTQGGTTMPAVTVPRHHLTQLCQPASAQPGADAASGTSVQDPQLLCSHLGMDSLTRASESCLRITIIIIIIICLRFLSIIFDLSAAALSSALTVQPMAPDAGAHRPLASRSAVNADGLGVVPADVSNGAAPVFQCRLRPEFVPTRKVNVPALSLFE
ncbi:hypothetical protein EYF80_005411 [Liparis tanakae]|uniref:Uncharacterized protein n=1 Tax=Liparis tanakae TaxID=230148 RepID=A0A4Z2J401_9TELE|nr:hypothetical protein EYF80_005411 [Liparis tanakae]